MDIKGKNTEYFHPESGDDWFLAGGIKDRNEAADDKEKELEFSSDGMALEMEKGTGHGWTRYCEDVALIYTGGPKVAAVFDGVSGPMDGSGGRAAREAAELLLQKIDRDNDDPDGVIDELAKDCERRITDGATTALIYFLEERLLFAKGDSICTRDGDTVNTPHSRGGALIQWLPGPGTFDRYEVGEGIVKLCSDGIYNKTDDRTVLTVDNE